jgi:biopolymer transport protein ExbD
MLASNFNKVGQINMEMTKESSSATNEDIKIIKLLIQQDQTVLSDGKVYNDNDLLIMIKLAIKDVSEYSIILTSKNDVTYQRFLSIMSFLKKNKLNNIRIGLKKNEINK